MKKNIIFIGLIVSLVLIAGCSSQPTSGAATVEPTGIVREFDVISRNWEFEPSILEVNQGDTVELHLTTEDIAHGFLLISYGINERIEPGDDVHVSFVADKKGTFPIACSVPCGRGHGAMSGKLIVK